MSDTITPGDIIARALHFDPAPEWLDDPSERVRPPSNDSDMRGFTAMVLDWLGKAVDGTVPGDPPEILYVQQGGEVYMVKTETANGDDWDNAITSPLAEAVAYLAEAWWSVQQAAMVHATRDLPRRADA